MQKIAINLFLNNPSLLIFADRMRHIKPLLMLGFTLGLEDLAAEIDLSQVEEQRRRKLVYVWGREKEG